MTAHVLDLTKPPKVLMLELINASNNSQFTLDDLSYSSRQTDSTVGYTHSIEVTANMGILDSVRVKYTAIDLGTLFSVVPLTIPSAILNGGDFDAIADTILTDYGLNISLGFHIVTNADKTMSLEALLSNYAYIGGAPIVESGGSDNILLHLEHNEMPYDVINESSHTLGFSSSLMAVYLPRSGRLECRLFNPIDASFSGATYINTSRGTTSWGAAGMIALSLYQKDSGDTGTLSVLNYQDRDVTLRFSKLIPGYHFHGCGVMRHGSERIYAYSDNKTLCIDSDGAGGSSTLPIEHNSIIMQTNTGHLTYIIDGVVYGIVTKGSTYEIKTYGDIPELATHKGDILPLHIGDGIVIISTNVHAIQSVCWEINLTTGTITKGGIANTGLITKDTILSNTFNGWFTFDDHDNIYHVRAASESPLTRN